MAMRIIAATGAGSRPMNEGAAQAASGGNVLPFDQSRRRSRVDDLFIRQRSVAPRPIAEHEMVLYRGNERVRVFRAPGHLIINGEIDPHYAVWPIDEHGKLNLHRTGPDRLQPIRALPEELSRIRPSHLHRIDGDIAPRKGNGRRVARVAKSAALKP